MAKKQGQRLKILYILDFLKRESDEDHPVTAEKICEYLETQGISAERKSVYSDISALSDAPVSRVISYGDRVKVLEPQRLRDMVVDRAEKVPEIYNQRLLI